MNLADGYEAAARYFTARAENSVKGAANGESEQSGRSPYRP